MTIIGEHPIYTNQLVPNKLSPRPISRPHVSELAEIMRKDRSAMELYPILVRAVGDESYEIIDGHHRVAACEMLGVARIFAKVVDMSDEDASYEVVRANSHLNLDILSYGRHYMAMKEKFGTTQEAYASEIGRGQPFVAKAKAAYSIYTSLSGALKSHVDESIVKGTLSGYHLAALSGVPEEDRESLILYASDPDNRISVKEMETLIKDELDLAPEPKEPGPKEKKPKREATPKTPADYARIIQAWISGMKAILPEILPDMEPADRVALTRATGELHDLVCE